MNEKLLFADYEHSLMLKELGFREPCVSFYDRQEVVHPNIQEVGTLISMKFTISESQEEKERLKDYDEDDYVFIDFIPSDDMKDVLRPTWQQVKQWLWEKHNIYIEIGETIREKFHYHIYKKRETDRNTIWTDAMFTSPVTAEINGIKKAIEHLREQKIRK
jgi:hypothetical protein